MRAKLAVSACVFVLCAVSEVVRACGGNEYEQCWRVNLVFGEAKDCKCLPKVGGDIGKIAEDTKKIINPVISEVRKSPDAIAQCLGDLNNCVVQILAAPLAAPVQMYIDNLYKQSEGRVRAFSPEFIALAQPYFSTDLRGITYADDINTGMGMNVSYCDRIFFIGHGSPWADENELFLMLHELEHTVQCQRRGKSTYLAEYVLKAGMDVLRSGRFDVHDIHDYEIAANAKASQLTGALWAKIQSGWAPIPGNGATSAGLPAPQMTPLSYCETQVGNCNISPVMLPAGTPCYCNTMSGPVSGAAF